MKKKIYIDFDDVLSNYDDWEEVRNLSMPKKGANNFIEKLSKNYKIYIFTTKDREIVYKWLIRHHFDDYIEDVTNKKEFAFVYIDDRAIKFNGNYSKMLTELKKIKPYWSPY
jgi:FMN phosphatase YigB (HAD superfamily)